MCYFTMIEAIRQLTNKHFASWSNYFLGNWIYFQLLSAPLQNISHIKPQQS